MINDGGGDSGTKHLQTIKNEKYTMNITTVLTYSLGPSLYRFCCSNAQFVNQELQV